MRDDVTFDDIFLFRSEAEVAAEQTTVVLCDLALDAYVPTCIDPADGEQHGLYRYDLDPAYIRAELAGLGIDIDGPLTSDVVGFDGKAWREVARRITAANL